MNGESELRACVVLWYTRRCRAQFCRKVLLGLAFSFAGEESLISLIITCLYLQASESGATLSINLIWGHTAQQHNLFWSAGDQGLANIDSTQNSRC